MLCILEIMLCILETTSCIFDTTLCILNTTLCILETTLCILDTTLCILDTYNVTKQEIYWLLAFGKFFIDSFSIFTKDLRDNISVLLIIFY